MRRLLIWALVAGTVAMLAGCGTIRRAVQPTQRCVATAGGATAEVNLEQARYAAIIAGVAAQRGLPPRAVSIALATALQESDLRNLDYGDRDSLGLFQQRPSQGWGTPEQIMDPRYSSGKFYEALVKVKGWQTGDINDVAQAVQRSGVPDGYRKHVERAKVLASALSGETAAAWSCLVREAAATDVATLQAELAATYGTQVTVAATADGVGLTVTASSDQVAWSVAAFAQSWAAKTGVRTVTYGEQAWSVSGTRVASWAPPPTPAPAQPLTVTIGF